MLFDVDWRSCVLRFFLHCDSSPCLPYHAFVKGPSKTRGAHSQLWPGEEALRGSL